MPSTSVLWFRRDLRVHDHPALMAAVERSDAVVPVFVIDDALLHGRWPAANRLWFMRESLVALSGALAERGVSLRILRGRPVDVLPAFARETGATDVYWTHDATPYGRSRDRLVGDRLAAAGIAVHAKRGLYVHEPDEVVTRQGAPYTVFSPFRRTWESLPRRAVLPAPEKIPGPAPARARANGGHPGGPSRGDSDILAFDISALDIPDMGAPTADPELIPAPGEAAARARLDAWIARGLDEYDETRNRLDRDGTSRLSQDLRWGLLSPVEVVDRAEGAGEGRRVFVSEVAWREFYAHVLWHHPRVLHEPFRDTSAAIQRREDPEAFDAWRLGRTGYPVVDAAMRQLRASGFMHNRARMIAASFLAKHLMLDWRLGEAEFMRHLTDGDAASNDGGWQWTAGTGTDPQPWLRVFNPILQGRRFDPDGAYVRRWVPELAGVPGAAIHEPWTLDPATQLAAGVRIGVDYPLPIVDHAEARERALALYGATRTTAEG
jgi:deoxyribodipyrimidine photo-lyase